MKDVIYRTINENAKNHIELKQGFVQKLKLALIITSVSQINLNLKPIDRQQLALFSSKTMFRYHERCNLQNHKCKCGKSYGINIRIFMKSLTGHNNYLSQSN